MKVILLGYGKMGKAIEEVLLSSANEVILKIAGNNISDLTAENLKKADVVIEFTTPATAIQNIEICLDAGVPLVIGTTGWYHHLPSVIEYCNQHDGALVYAANFSIGVNIFFEINKQLAELMADKTQYRSKIEETHHAQKLDSPSGTAIKIAEQIMNKNRNIKKWVDRDSDNIDELEIISHRIENIPGTHEVMYTSEADEIKIVHTAFSRKGFAEGAVLAAKWIQGKKGVFTMQNVLGI